MTGISSSIESIGITLNAARTNLNPDSARHHIRAALEAGATLAVDVG